jgi:hypothetical protein
MNTGTPLGFINSSSITFADLALTTSIAGTVNGLTIGGNTTNGYIPRQTNIKNVAFRGHLPTAWWATNIALYDLSDVFIDGVGIYGLNNTNTNTNGTGILYAGSSNGTTPTVLNITNLTEFFLATGINANGYWKGLNISQTNIVDVTTGISSTAASPQPQCTVTASQINAARHSIVYNNMQTSTISGNLFYQGAYTGLVNGDAILQLGVGSNIVVANNTFSGFTLGGATPNCVDISGVNIAIVSSNTFAGCGTNIVAGGSYNSFAIGNVNADGIPHTGGGPYFAYLGVAELTFPYANMEINNIKTVGIPSLLIQIGGNTANGYIPRQTNIKNVAFRGHLTTAWWAINIALYDLSDVFIDGVGIYGLNNTNTNGTGILYSGSSNGTTPTVINVTNVTEFFLAIGINATGYWQGLNVSQTNIVDASTGISCTAVSPQPQCTVTASQINAARHSMSISILISSLFINKVNIPLILILPIR